MSQENILDICHFLFGFRGFFSWHYICVREEQGKNESTGDISDQPSVLHNDSRTGRMWFHETKKKKKNACLNYASFQLQVYCDWPTSTNYCFNAIQYNNLGNSSTYTVWLPSPNSQLFLLYQMNPQIRISSSTCQIPFYNMK